MSTHLMVGNGKGWDKVATCNRTANTGHAADGVGVALPDGFSTFELGTEYRAQAKADARTMNKAMNSQGWVAHTMLDTRIHESGAVVKIDRNIEVDGVYYRAIYRRTK